MSRYFIERMDGPAEGPVEFRDLVVQVRHGSVVADQRVREEHGDWMYAGDVIGLFAMAGRSDAVAIWEAERRHEAEAAAEAERNSDPEDHRATDETLDLLEIDSAGGDLADVDDTDGVETRWQRRLHEVTEQRAAEAASDQEAADNAGEDETVLRRIQELKEQAIHASVVESDERARARRPGWFSSLGARVSRRAIRACFHWGVAAAFAVTVACGIYSWSTTESMRFPRKGDEVGTGWIFPGWGHCATEEYWFLLVDAAILAGLAGFIIARWAEQLTSD